MNIDSIIYSFLFFMVYVVLKRNKVTLKSFLHRLRFLHKTDWCSFSPVYCKLNLTCFLGFDDTTNTVLLKTLDNILTVLKSLFVYF